MLVGLKPEIFVPKAYRIQPSSSDMLYLFVVTCLYSQNRFPLLGDKL